MWCLVGMYPVGSGMSSSAALECGTCFALNEIFDLRIPKVEMVKISAIGGASLCRCHVRDHGSIRQHDEDIRIRR